MEQLLRELVEINSIFPNENKISSYLYDALEELNFNLERQKIEGNRYNILGKRGSGKRKLGFYAHMDSVPVQGEWKEDPFRLRVENRNAIGLGAYDMKAGIAAILRALESESNCEIRVAFGIDEENNSLGASKILESNFFSGCDLVIVPEINDSPIHGEGTVLLGRRGRIRFEINVFGQSCHGASGGGINAITEASKLIQALERMENSRSKNMEGSQFVNAINARAQSLSYPDRCNVELDVHLVDGETRLNVLERIRRIIKENGINAEVEIQERDVPYLMPYWNNDGNSEIERVSSIVRETFGKVNYSYGKSVADECIITKMAPVISICALGGNAHREEEWVNLDSLEKLKNIFRRILK